MKKSLCVLLLLAMCLSLVACAAPKKEDVIGSWYGTWEYNGNTITEALVIGEDGTWSSVITNGGDTKVKAGVWKVDGKKVVLGEDSSYSSRTEYDYSKGALVNNGHKLIKQ